MAEYLGTVKLGTFYHNGEALSLPTRPWYSNKYPGSLSSRGNGNIPTFSGEIKDWTIGDTSSDDNKKLKWVKIKDGNKTLLICDRNILHNISWNTLNETGYVDGTKITIDGNDYLCRLLTGGNDYRNGNDNYSGGTPTDNEWDRFICNEDGIKGLPNPTTSDLDKTLDYDDLDGEHNKLWNWWGNGSCCKEAYKKNTSSRGFNSARYFYYTTSYGTYDYYGWRPVLEVLNSDNENSDTKKFLIKQNDNYYTINNGYIDLGQINTKDGLNNLFDEHGFKDLYLITKESNGKKIHMSKDKNDIWETDSELDMNKVEGDLQLVEENNEKYIKYGFGECDIPDEIKKINEGKFKILMK
ncbi:hypothetical protein HYI18_17305 [Clostridium botulinum]|uniref:hypothetical protein n=1 Tax=Clostridium TaxID=1485 RepID=UPI00090C4003|nr:MULTISPECIES: hypothetical protein [Clostridium]APF28172.1 hypothetical protein NPD7_50 [Clostridium sporogenes]MBD5640320.1 hypothetical protein [Clostridium botulinum]MDI6918833.1 hypothetical protein [Clostridium botulinum]WMU97074.1 hypothetical protein QA656_15055 [Clostridium botulinum]